MPEHEALSDAQLLEELGSFFARHPQFADALKQTHPGQEHTAPNHDPERPPQIPDVLAPPQWLVTAAQDVYSLRGIDALLAELTWDSLLGDGPVLMRSTGITRMLSFETVDLTVDLEVTGGPQSYRIVGQVAPATPDTIEVNRLPVGQEPGDQDRTPHVDNSSPALTAVVDSAGQFVLEEIPSGRIRLLFHRDQSPCVRTDWFHLG